MKRKSVLGVSLALLTLAGGCALQPQANGMRMNVALTVNVSDDGYGGCTITSPPEPKVGNHHNAVLVWNISPASKYSFDTNGINFVSGKPDPLPAGEFVQRNASGTTWVMFDANKNKGRFGYEIHVKVNANGKTCKLDPTVYNDGTCSDGSC